MRFASFWLRMLLTHVLRALVLRRCDAGAMGLALDEVFRRLNDGVLPATQQAFGILFCRVLADHATHGIRNPWTHGRGTDGDDGLRLRCRFKWRAQSINLPGIYVRDQQPATREATLLAAAQGGGAPRLHHLRFKGSWATGTCVGCQ